MSTCPNGCCLLAGGLAAPPPSGCLVRIVGLSGRADLNGKFGIVKPLDHPRTAASEKADRDREVYIRSTPGAAAKLRKIPRSQQVGFCVNPETGFTLARNDPRLEMYAYGDFEIDPRYPVRVLSKMKPEVLSIKRSNFELHPVYVLFSARIALESDIDDLLASCASVDNQACWGWRPQVQNQHRCCCRVA